MPRKAKWRTRTNTHHIFWERGWYTTPTELKFRELDCMKVEIDRHAHDILNHLKATPPKPSEQMMELAIARHENRECCCFERRQPRKRR